MSGSSCTSCSSKFDHCSQCTQYECTACASGYSLWGDDCRTPCQIEFGSGCMSCEPGLTCLVCIGQEGGGWCTSWDEINGSGGSNWWW